MPIVIKKAPDAARLARELNGYVSSKRNLNVGRDNSPNPAVAGQLFKHPVNGLTLDISTPSVTVTFSGDRDMFEIVADINAAAGATIAHLERPGADERMELWLYDDTTPVTLAETGTANTYFGFSTTTGDPRLVQSPTTPTDIIDIVVENLSRQYVAFIDG